MDESNGLNLFMDLLNKIYGKDIIDKVIEKDSISFKSKEELDKIFEELNVKKVIKGRCNECEGLINPKMDLPGWLGKLDFTKTHVRKVMVIGEDPSGKILGISYGLGHEDIETYEWKRGTNLWWYLKELIGIGYEDFKNFYCTDICKCGAKAQNKHKICWEQCFNTYLTKEIELINPEIIIAHGGTADKFLKKIYKDEFKEYVPIYHVRYATLYGGDRGKTYIREKGKGKGISSKIEKIRTLIRS